MKRMNRGVWAGIFILLFALLFFLQSLAFPYIGPLGPGPGFFPVWLSGILFILAILYIIESIKGANASEEPVPDKKALKNIVFIVACMIVFAVMLPYAGFVLSGTVFLFLLLYREYRWYANLGISFGISFFTFWLFGSVLGVALPVNPLGW
jgi:putative tricarboxylic transport membrane protein